MAKRKTDRWFYVRVSLRDNADLLYRVPCAAANLQSLLSAEKHFAAVQYAAALSDVLRIECWALGSPFYRIPDAIQHKVTSLWTCGTLPADMKIADTDGATISITNSGVYWTAREAHGTEDFETPELSYAFLKKEYDKLVASAKP